MGKGSRRRPQAITDEEMALRWAKTFGAKEVEPLSFPLSCADCGCRVGMLDVWQYFDGEDLHRVCAKCYEAAGKFAS